MTRKTVDVEVFDGDETIDVAHERPVRLMPCGKAAIVYRERVYPLHEGNIIRLEDLPLDVELCQRFVAWDEPIPYCSDSEEEWDFADDAMAKESLGIGSWYLESSKLGHYVAFDASEAGAQRLAAAIKDSDLGLVKLDESFRPAADGHQYDWYIRLKFRGPRDQCLRILEGILGGANSPDGNEAEPQTNSPGQSVSHWEIVTQALALLADPEQRDEVRQTLDAFGDGYGYLSWRFRQVVSNALPSPADGVRTLGKIVAEDKELIARLETEYGDFLEEDEEQRAQRAIDVEFERIDLEDSWNSGDGALRRSRASTRFLRKAVVLTIASGDYPDRLQPMLNRLKPPASVQFNRTLPTHVTIAVETLRGTISQVEALFAGDFLGELYMFSQIELQGIQSGELDFLTPALSPAPSTTDQQQMMGDLPFVILPPGERIQSIVGDLKKSARYSDREVDFERIKVLIDLSEMIGVEHCSLYSGIFPSSGRDNGYVVLVVSFEDYGEDAIAVSPWKNEHATYVVRAFDHPWRYVLSQTKDEAIQLGARRLHFKANPGHDIDEYEAMREKILALMDCGPDEFETGALYFDPYQDRYVLREGERRRPRAAKSVRQEPNNNESPGFFKRIMNWIERNVEFE